MHKYAIFSRRGSAGNPVVLHRVNPAAFRAVRIRNLSDDTMTIGVRHTEDEGLWDASLPEFAAVTIVTGTNDKIDFDEGGSELTAAIAAGTYTTAIDLGNAVETAMNAVASGTIEVIWNFDLRKFTVRSDTELNLLWKTGTNGADGNDISAAADLGFDDAADDSGAQTYQSDSAVGASASWTAGSAITVEGNAFKDTSLPAAGKILELSVTAGVFEITLLDDQNTTDATEN